MTDNDRRLLQQALNWIRSFKLTGPFVSGRSSLQSGASYHVGSRGRENPGGGRDRIRLVGLRGPYTGADGVYHGTILKGSGPQEEIENNPANLFSSSVSAAFVVNMEEAGFANTGHWQGTVCIAMKAFCPSL